METSYTFEIEFNKYKEMQVKFKNDEEVESKK